MLDVIVCVDKRPFGVQLLIFSYNTERHAFDIYQCDPTGEVSKWSATAIGKNSRKSCLVCCMLLIILFYSAKYIKDLENGWNKSLTGAEVVELIAKFIDRDVTETENTTNEDKPSRTDLVHRMFYRLHRVNDTSRLTYYPNKDEMLKSLT